MLLWLPKWENFLDWDEWPFLDSYQSCLREYYARDVSKKTQLVPDQRVCLWISLFFFFPMSSSTFHEHSLAIDHPFRFYPVRLANLHSILRGAFYYTSNWAHFAVSGSPRDLAPFHRSLGSSKSIPCNPFPLRLSTILLCGSRERERKFLAKALDFVALRSLLAQGSSPVMDWIKLTLYSFPSAKHAFTSDPRLVVLGID